MPIDLTLCTNRVELLLRASGDSLLMNFVAYVGEQLLRSECIWENEASIRIQKTELGEGDFEPVELMSGCVRINARIVWALDLFFEALRPSVDHALRLDCHTLDDRLPGLFNDCIG